MICATEHEISDAARAIIRYAGDERVWLFYGQMGAGKTTFIKAIARMYNIEDIVHSPTFNIVNEYQNDEGASFFHFDFYRIKNEMEALDIGLDEYFESGSHCFIEWPEKIESLLPDHFLRIEISIADNLARHINLFHYGK